MKSIDLYHSTTLEGEIEALRNINADLLETLEKIVHLDDDLCKCTACKIGKPVINKAKGE